MKPIIRPGEPGYRRCSVTVMDTTDPDITFDEQGRSNWVKYFEDTFASRWKPEGNPAAFQRLMDRIRSEGRNKQYDCAIGLSGGVDSSYLAYLVKREGLRPLVIHTDVGWNSEAAVRNIENIVNKCGFDLFTVVINWDAVADLQRAFLRAGVPNQDIPQDHAIFAAFFGLAAKHRIRYVIAGINIACESIMPPSWGYDAFDVRHIRAIHRRFGERPLRDYPLMGKLRYGIGYQILRGMQILKPLDLLPYSKADAIRILEKEFGWQYYGGKHFESRWTRFFQAWWLPTRFGYDKRVVHLSSLILSGQITRAAALAELEVQPYPESLMREDLDLVLKKLDMSRDEWNALLSKPVHAHGEYPQERMLGPIMRAGQRWMRRLGVVR
jgi:N-acetyl sugar amidotransferase